MPADSTFVFGTLMMPQEATAPSSVSLSIWHQDPALCIVTILAAVIFLIFLKNTYRILPAVFKSIFRWKEGLNLENSMQQSRTRSWVSVAFILPFCLVVHACLLPSGNILTCLSYFFLYYVARLVIFKLFKYRLYNEEYLTYSHKCVYNYFIVLSLISFITGGVLHFSNSGPEVSSRLILYEILIVYILCIGRRIHFLRCKYHGFPTFLYLCALEFLPGGLLVYLCLR